MILKDKVILITGSTDGIGRAIAERSIAEGAKVMIHGRNEEKAKKAKQALGDSVEYILGDLSDPGFCKDLVAKTHKHFGQIDGLINNAGIYPRNNLDTATAAFFDEVMAINLRAPMLMSRECVKIFRQQHTKGSIVNIGSINAYCGQTDILIYSMSKGGLMTMTRNLGDSLGTEGIRVNQLNVGWSPTDTERGIKAKEGLPDDWEENVSPVFAPSGRLISPEQISHHAVFWVSELSAPVNGAVYDVEQYPVIGRNKISG